MINFYCLPLWLYRPWTMIKTQYWYGWASLMQNVFSLMNYHSIFICMFLAWLSRKELKQTFLQESDKITVKVEAARSFEWLPLLIFMFIVFVFDTIPMMCIICNEWIFLFRKRARMGIGKEYPSNTLQKSGGDIFHEFSLESWYLSVTAAG